MIRKELTLEATYVREWGLDEGIREFVSNAFDAEIENGAEVEIFHRNESDKLIITTKGATLSREVLLFGHSSKMDRGDLIGHFGEGLKLGSLACVRAGHPVVIRTGSEVWRPLISRSESYNADVLAVEIVKGNKFVNRVSVEIENITFDMWLKIKSQFLRLNPMPESDKIVVPYQGTILLSPDYKGKIFVKGIAVKTDRRLQHGYDLINATVDRDRKMISSWDLQWYSKGMWINAVNISPEFRTTFARMAASSAPDLTIESLNDINNLYDEALDDIIDAFESEYGEDAFPVDSLAESKEVEFFGKKGIVVSQAYRTILSKKLGTIDALKESFRYATDKKYSLTDLTYAELSVLNEAVADVCLAIPDLSENIIDVSDFKDERTLGLFNRENGRIELSRKLLTDVSRVRVTLVHEATHMLGDDGTKSHEDAQCCVWAQMFDVLKQKIDNL
jgi:hypothetical protein